MFNGTFCLACFCCCIKKYLYISKRDGLLIDILHPNFRNVPYLTYLPEVLEAKIEAQPNYTNTRNGCCSDQFLDDEVVIQKVLKFQVDLSM